MNKKLYHSVILSICVITVAKGQAELFSWPGNAKAAICLTYDDGMDTQLNDAIPDLDNHNLKGTFYLQGDKIPYDRIDDWRNVSARGHELGNHTVFHPCSGEFSWVWPEFQTEEYTIRRMIKELGMMNSFLYAIDGKRERTFAYACSETGVGGVSYIDSLRRSGLFTGARSGGAGVVENPPELDIFNVPSWCVNETVKASDLIKFVDTAAEAGGMAVFMFHGIGGQYLYISGEDHTTLLDYLQQNRDTFWVAPFGDVMEHIVSERNRIGCQNWALR